MKVYFLVLCVTILNPLNGLTQTKKQVWKPSERQLLIQGLKSSIQDLMDETSGFSDDQILYKPDSGQWSIAEVIEHLGIYEELLYWDLLNNQYTEERHDLVDKVNGIDSAMTAYASDPNKGQASLVALPLGRFQTKKELLHYFNIFRMEVIKLIEETKVDFRLHFILRPPDWGIWHIRDLHQYTLVWIAHTQRHLNQIKKIKSHPGFPEK